MGKPGVCFCLRGRTLWSGQECKEPLPVQNGHWKIDFIQRFMFMDKKSNSSWWKSWEMYWHEKRACQAVVTAIYQPLGENGEQRSGWWFAQIHTDSHNYDSAWACTSAGAVKLQNEAFTDSLCKDVGLQEFSCLCETACCCCYSTDNNNLFEWIQ